MDEEKLVKEVTVQGAGVDAVNGTYRLNGIQENCGIYQRFAHWNGMDRTFSLYHWKNNLWYISIFAHNGPGYNDIDFYIRDKDDPMIHPGKNPPLLGWKVCGEEGVEPAPTVTLKGTTSSHESKVSMLKALASAYESMLFSEDFSDVKLVCKDGEVIPAHKCVLAATCSYFKAAFSGHWKESDKGELEIQHSSDIVKTVLSMLYTGVLNAVAINKDPLAFMNIASELDLPWLNDLAEASCCESITEQNLKDMWQAAHLYDSSKVKCSCIEYARENPLEVLAYGDIQSLRTDDPPSWEEFAQGIQKKARHK